MEYKNIEKSTLECITPNSDTYNIKSFGGKKYRAIKFISNKEGDIACNHCAFELGKCRGAIWVLGQCYIINEDEIEKNIYYEEIKELIF